MVQYIHTDSNVLIVDLREEKEYIQSHIPGAWNLVYDEEEETKEFIIN